MEKNPYRQPFGDYTNREIAEQERIWKQNAENAKIDRIEAKKFERGTVFRSGGNGNNVVNNSGGPIDEVARERSELSADDEGEHRVG